jgi:hypothetical protein
VYNAALPTAGLMRVALGSFGVIVMPVVTGLYAQKRCPELRNIYSTVTKWIIAIVFPGFLLMLLFAKPIMWILFGSDYVAGATALVILAFGYLVTSVCGRADHYSSRKNQDNNVVHFLRLISKLSSESLFDTDLRNKWGGNRHCDVFYSYVPFNGFTYI